MVRRDQVQCEVEFWVVGLHTVDSTRHHVKNRLKFVPITAQNMSVKWSLRLGVGTTLGLGIECPLPAEHSLAFVVMSCRSHEHSAVVNRQVEFGRDPRSFTGSLLLMPVQSLIDRS